MMYSLLHAKAALPITQWETPRQHSKTDLSSLWDYLRCSVVAMESWLTQRLKILYKHTCVCMHAYNCIHTCMNAHMHIYAHTCACTCMHMHMHTHKHKHVHMHALACMCAHTHIFLLLATVGKPLLHWILGFQLKFMLTPFCCLCLSWKAFSLGWMCPF